MNKKSTKNTLHLQIKDKNSNNYRGAFYNDTTEKEFYEFGAHFSYKELYSRLIAIKKNQTQKELLRKNIKLKIIRNKSNNISKKKRSINVINNNNIHLTNLNVNVNVNINNDSSSILERLNKIEQTVFKGVKVNLSRNNKTCSYQRNVCNGYKNLTLINANPVSDSSGIVSKEMEEKLIETLAYTLTSIDGIDKVKIKVGSQMY